MKILQQFFFAACLAVFASSCGTPPQEEVVLPFVLVTAAPNASLTPTPFQPALETPTPLRLEDLPTLTPLPTSTHEAAQTSPPLPPTETLATKESFFTQTVILPTALPPLTTENETVNFLLIGSDRRPGGTSHRTDTLIIAIVWFREGQISLISIPRDIWLNIPNVGMQRINTAYQSGESDYLGGGMALLKETILQNFGIRIDHTAMIEFDGFRNLVDTLGGFDVPIACPYTDWRLIAPYLDENDEDNWQLYTIGPGQVHMDGDLALWYARSRSKSSDFDRERRQQEVIRAAFQKALQSGTFTKIPQLYEDFSSAVITDMSLGNILRLAPYAVNFTNANIRGYYIRPPYVASWTTDGGAAVLLPQDSLNSLLVEATTLSAYAEKRKTILIEVQNGASFDTLDALAAARLNYAGYETTLSPADNRNYETTVLVDYSVAQDAVQRETVLNILGASSANVLSMPNANSKIQYRVILGADYEACFRPEDLTH